MTLKLSFKTGGKAIAAEFTDQRLFPHAGMATSWGEQQSLDCCRGLAGHFRNDLPALRSHFADGRKGTGVQAGGLADGAASALGLPSVTQMLSDRAAGLDGLVTMVFVITSVALGTLAGASAYKWLTEKFGWWQLQIGRVGRYFQRGKKK